jgi:hypothetical protein
MNTNQILQKIIEIPYYFLKNVLKINVQLLGFVKMNELVKECTKCGEDKFLGEFYRKLNQCKKCNYDIKMAHTKKKHEDAIKKNVSKTCDICKKEKSINNFPIDRLICKDCKNAKSREQVKKNYNDAIKKNEPKTCKECKKEKPVTEFSIGHNECKDCINTKQREERKENVLDQVSTSMIARTPKDNRNPKEYYINILTELLKNQENKCFYSGELLTVNQGCYNTISPERLDESIRGYNDTDNVRAICQLFQSGSRPVNIDGSTIITSEMRKQILERPYTIQRISNEKGQDLTPGRVYKKVINFNIDFNNEEEVKEEMKYLPNKMKYDKTIERFRVINKDGKEEYFGKTKVGFKLAMKYWKDQYKHNYEIDYNNKYNEYLIYSDELRKIKICPETNFMTNDIRHFKIQQMYNKFPDCSPGKAQWSKEKFDLVKELSKREDSQERKDFIDKMINVSREIVENYRNNDVKIEKHTDFTLIVHRFANRRSVSSSGHKQGEYKDIFLTIYDKICRHRFRCEYTNIPMSLSACKDWQMSFERFDNSKNYNRKNIAIVCKEFNTRFHWMPKHFKKFWDIDVQDYIKEKLNPSFNLSRRHRFY